MTTCPTVIAAVADAEWCAHVREILGAWTRLTFTPTVRALGEEVTRDTPDVVLWHLGSTMDADDASVAALRRFRLRSPRSMVVAYCSISVAVAPLLVAAGRASIDRLLLRGYDDLATNIRGRPASNSIEAVSREILCRMAPPSGPAWEVVAHCVRRAATTVLTVEHLANELGVHRKTLNNWLRAAGLPSPEQIIGWTRLMLAVMLLEDRHRSIASVASQVGFSSEGAFRGMLIRYTGFRPREMRQADGFARLCQAFRDTNRRPNAEKLVLPCATH